MNEQELQEKILEQIKKNPGIHLSKIAEQLNLRITEVERHLHILETLERIHATAAAGYQRYYLITKERNYSKQKLQTRNDIYTLIAQRPGLYRNKIAEILNMSIQLVDYHISVLLKNKKIISIQPPPGEYHTRYYIAESDIGGQEKLILEILAKKGGSIRSRPRAYDARVAEYMVAFKADVDAEITANVRRRFAIGIKRDTASPNPFSLN